MRILFLIIFIGLHSSIIAQAILKPGFDAKEYIAAFSLSKNKSSIPDSVERAKQQDPYKLVYRSKETGLKNLWMLFINNQKTAVITIRGTVGDKISWAENFYAAMVPAKGSLQMNDSTTFNYKLASDENAAIHTGWLFGLGSMAPAILQNIKEQYANGVKEYILFGHSQGGAIAYLLRSYLYYLQQDGRLPADIYFKTYCSAAPKPGNTNYAYDFEFINRGGWQYTVVNTTDWVPETPYSVQRMQDMNEVNPLIHIKEGLKKQKFPLRLMGNYYYGKANRKPRKLQYFYTKFFGNLVYSKAIKQAQPQFSKPQYVQSMNYARAGNAVILLPDSDYYKIFDQKGIDYFVNHSFQAYYYLIKKDYLIKK